MAGRTSSGGLKSNLAPPRVTMQDVVRVAGVSGSSVSNYMTRISSDWVTRPGCASKKRLRS